MNSPLRYPGGKAKIYNKVVKLLNNNFTEKPIYVEAFAGGASLALKLLMNDLVAEIHINDLDKAIYSFWYSILHHTDEFIEQINDAVFNIDEWRKQKAIYKSIESTVFDLGFATFYLNRTNRSGVLSAGPIGGQNQNGDYRMNCRFNKEKLIEHINAIKALSDRIHIYNLDAKEFLKTIDENYDNAIFFLDPPYVKQGPNLYLNHLKENDHRELKDSIISLRNSWFVTYDNQELIWSLYAGYRIDTYDINYSLARKRVEQEVFIYSNTLNV